MKLEFKKKICEFLGKRNPVFLSQLLFYRHHGYRINLESPSFFSEKLVWLKFYYSVNNDAILAADKYGLHEYISNKGIEDLTVPLIKVYDSVDEVILEDLPNQFVVKKSNASALNAIVLNKDEFSEEQFKTMLSEWMDTDFGLSGAELHYLRAKSRIIVEEYIEDLREDWKIFFINGEAEMIQVNHWIGSPTGSFVGHRETIRLWIDLKGNILEIGRDRGVDNSKFKVGDKITMPSDLNRMIEYGKKIASDFPMVRVDFFHDGNDRLYLGELTFTPGNATEKFNEYIQKSLGEKLILPKDINIKKYIKTQ